MPQQFEDLFKFQFRHSKFCAETTVAPYFPTTVEATSGSFSRFRRLTLYAIFSFQFVVLFLSLVLLDCSLVGSSNTPPRVHCIAPCHNGLFSSPPLLRGDSVCHAGSFGGHVSPLQFAMKLQEGEGLAGA